MVKPLNFLDASGSVSFYPKTRARERAQKCGEWSRQRNWHCSQCK